MGVAVVKSRSARKTRALNRAPPVRDLVKARESDVVERFDRLSGSILLTEREVALITGHTVNSLKYWRLHGSSKGPPSVKMPTTDCVRYRTSAVRAWLAGSPE